MRLEDQYIRVLDSFALLAASYDEQKMLLPEFPDIPDDVVSTFEGSFLLLPQLVEADRFSHLAIAVILRVYNMLQWNIYNTPHI